MAPLMRVMGRDAKGRGVLRRMVEDALNKGMTPMRDAEAALQPAATATWRASCTACAARSAPWAPSA